MVAARRGKVLLGGYTAYVRRNGKLVSRITFKTDKDNNIVSPPAPGRKALYDLRVKRFLNSLARLNIAFFYLTDERELLRNVPPVQNAARLSVENREGAEGTITDQLRLRAAARRRGKVLDVALSQAAAAAIEWTKEQVLSGSKQGESDANSIYAEIVKRLAGLPDTARRNQRTNVRQLISTLKEQAARSQEFAKFGFPAAVNSDELVRSLDSARRELPTIYKIVGPFVAQRGRNWTLFRRCRGPFRVLLIP